MKLAKAHHLLAAALVGVAVATTAYAADPKAKTAGEVVDDAAIATKVKAKLLADEKTSGIDITVETRKGTVQLAGFASSQAEIEHAGKLARETEGVKEVKNDIRLKPKG